MEFDRASASPGIASSVSDKVACDWCNGTSLECYAFPSGRICSSCYLSIEWVDKPENVDSSKSNVIFGDFNIEVIKHLRAKCPNSKNGCPLVMAFADIEKHVCDCIHRGVPCPNKCGINVKRRLLTRHITTECQRNVEDCEYCGEGFMRNQMDHHKKICPDREEACTYCGECGIKQKTLSMHYKVCPLMPKSCKMKKMGCSFVDISENLKIHEKSCKDHFSIIVDSTLESLELKDEVMSIQDKLNLMQLDMSQELHDLVKSNMELRETVQNLQRDTEVLKKQGEQLIDTVLSLKTGASVLKEENVVLKKTVQTLTKTIKDLEDKNANSKEPSNNPFENSFNCQWNTAKIPINPPTFPMQSQLASSSSYPGMFNTQQIASIPLQPVLPMPAMNQGNWKWINAPP